MNKISSLRINDCIITRSEQYKAPSAQKAAEKFLNNYGSQQTNAGGQTETIINKDQFLQALSKLPKPPNQNLSTAEELFKQADTNNDGVLTQSELISSMQQMQKAHHPPDPSKFVSAEGVSKSQLIQNIVQDMQKNAPQIGSSEQVDNRSRLLERATKIADKLFGADANNDGKLTTEEVQSMKTQRQQNNSNQNISLIA